MVKNNLQMLASHGSRLTVNAIIIPFIELKLTQAVDGKAKKLCPPESYRWKARMEFENTTTLIMFG